MSRVPLWALAHPVLAGALVGALTIALALQIVRLEIDPSADGLMVQGDPARRHYEDAKARFGSDNLTVVLVKADDVFTLPVLEAVRRMSGALERLEGVRHVESLTTVTTVKAAGDTLHAEPLVGTLPAGPAELARIRAEALGHRVLVGHLVSRDARAAAINVYADAAPADRQFNGRLAAGIEAVIAAEASAGLRVYQIGVPLTKATYAGHVKADTLGLMPIALGALLAILLLVFRTPQAVVIPAVTAGLAVVWSLGLMALAGVPLNTLTSMIPSLLIAIGFTEDVHMLAEYHRRLAAGEGKRAALRSMVRAATAPIAVTSLTTVVGFGALITTDITMLIQFGRASAMALTANFVLTLLVVPVLLRAWPVPRRLRGVHGTGAAPPARLAPGLERLGEFSLRHRGAIAAGAGLAVAASFVGWTSLRVDNDFIGFFPEQSFIRQRVLDLHRSLAGGVLFTIVVETHRPGGVAEPAVLRAIAGLQEFLAATGRIDATVSAADHVRVLHRAMNGGDPAFETIPDTREHVAQYLLMLEGPDLARLVDADASTASIAVRHNLTSSWQLSALLAQLEAHAAATFPPGVSVRPTGETILVNNAADYMAVNELTSFSFTFVVIAAVHSVLFRSVRAGVLSLIPNAVPVLTVFGLMGMLGIPLNVGTAMIATIAIGIAVDDTVHHMMTYRRQLDRYRDRRLAMLWTLQAQARPIVSISVALAAGFLVLVFSNFVPTVHFGVLSALVMLVAMVAELVLTPVLMYSLRVLPVREGNATPPA